jgi:DNA repair protein RadA/Sms
VVGDQYAPVKTIGLDEIDEKKFQRISTGIGELDRVLGGGLVPGSLILLGGEPGIGKSTLALQLATLNCHPRENGDPGKTGERLDPLLHPANRGNDKGTLSTSTLYFSGEESVEQIKLRANRLQVNSSSLRFANATNVESIVATITRDPLSVSPLKGGENDEALYQPDRKTQLKKAKTNGSPPFKEGAGGGLAQKLAIIDSIQTLYSDEVEGSAGNVNQMKACAVKLMEAAKATGTVIILIGQVTKDGAVAGPKTLEHLVDTVLYLEGDRFHNFRILRAVKNRFGSTDEVGIFAMEECGLVEVKNPSQALLAERPTNVPGSAVACLIEGTRPLLVEIQALVTKTNFGYPVRRASGFDLNRLQVLIGVLTKRASLPLDGYDVFINVVGGITADEPAADLAVILALASGFKNKELPRNLCACGEVGLGGEVRSVPQIKKRLEEIKKLGFEFAVIPATTESQKFTGLKIVQLKNVKEVVEQVVK